MNRQSYFVALTLLLVLISGSRLIAQELTGSRSATDPLFLSETPIPDGDQFLTEIRYAFTNQQWEELS